MGSRAVSESGLKSKPCMGGLSPIGHSGSVSLEGLTSFGQCMNGSLNGERLMVQPWLIPLNPAISATT